METQRREEEKEDGVLLTKLVWLEGKERGKRREKEKENETKKLNKNKLLM